MAVNLYICETLANSNTSAPVQFSDTLSGGGTGIDFGQVSTGSYAPLIDQNTNAGSKVVYLSHNALVDPITDLEVYLDEYSQTYGGGVNPSSNLSTMSTEGAASTQGSGDKNNSNGTTSGAWIDLKWDVSSSNQFDYASRPNDNLIFGKNSPNGIGPAQGRPFSLQSSAYAMYAPDALTESAPTAPFAGKIGKSSGSGFAGDSVLGNRAKMRKRIFLRSSFASAGIFQFDYVYQFSFTS